MNATLRKISIVFFSIVIALAVVGLFLPQEFKVGKSIVIKAPPQAIHTYVEDLRRWPEWTPWSDADPSVKIEYGDISRGKGASQTWRASDGGGRLTITQSSPRTGIEYDLYFNEDASRNIAAMRYEVVAEGTRVTWTMQGKMDIPVLGGYLSMLIGPMTGGMFDRGLAKLKALVERES